MNVGDIRAASDTTRVGGAVDDVRIRERRRRRARKNVASFSIEKFGPRKAVEALAGRDDVTDEDRCSVVDRYRDSLLIAAADWEKLADMLGLDPPVDEPAGYCRRCGKELALANTSTAGRHGIRRGYCGQACSRRAAEATP